MPTYEVALSDGRKFRVEADGQPSEADILAQLGQSPAAEEKSVGGLLGNAWEDAKGLVSGTAEMARGALDPTSLFLAKTGMAREADQAGHVKEMQAYQSEGRPVPQFDIPGALNRAGHEIYEKPVSAALAVAPMVPAAVRGASKVAGIVAPAVKGAARMATSVPGAVALDVAELALPRTTRAVRGVADMVSKARAAKAPEPPPAPSVAPAAQAATGQPLLDALMRGASYDELSALAGPAKAAPKVAAKSSLVDEVAAREALAKPIDWRTTDVTPIKKPGKGIILGEESTPGLLKLLQDALLAKNKPLAENIQTAIRQRSHITGKVGS